MANGNNSIDISNNSRTSNGSNFNKMNIKQNITEGKKSNLAAKLIKGRYGNYRNNISGI